MRELFVGDVAVLETILAREFATHSAAALTKRGVFVVALPGGSVAQAFFPAIARLDLDWARAHFFWIDERAVPPDDPASNYALASRLLFTPANVSPTAIHRMRGELDDLAEAARQAAEELTSVAGDPPRFDLALVGVGEDGHVASIFSSAAEDGGLVAPVYDAPKPPPRRLTLTMPVLAGARAVIVAALGHMKADVMQDALEDDTRRTPVAELLRRAPSAVVMLDRAAARL